MTFLVSLQGPAPPASSPPPAPSTDATMHGGPSEQLDSFCRQGQPARKKTRTDNYIPDCQHPTTLEAAPLHNAAATEAHAGQGEPLCRNSRRVAAEAGPSSAAATPTTATVLPLGPQPFTTPAAAAVPASGAANAHSCTLLHSNVGMVPALPLEPPVPSISNQALAPSGALETA